MDRKEIIATYYSNARELVKQKNPKAARDYVLAILNEALKTYHSTESIVNKAKTAAFMERWIAVSRDLYEVGISNYVLECFGLYNPVRIGGDNKSKGGNSPKTEPKSPKKETPYYGGGDDEINIDGLIDDISDSQGWCADVFYKNRNAIAEVHCSSNSPSCGSGFVISKNGYLLTNHHVAFDEAAGQFYTNFYMKLYGQTKKHKLQLVYADEDYDVALCKFDASEVENLDEVTTIDDYSKLLPGADCLIVGNGHGNGLAPFSGIVRFTENYEGDLVYTAPSNPGDSGGPVFDRKGECIGINKSTTLTFGGEEANGYANATPMNKIKELLDQWTKKGSIQL